MTVFRLPVSRIDVVLREPGGAEDLLLAEAAAIDTRLAIALLERLAIPAGPQTVDWWAAPIADIDAALLGIRRRVFGDRLRADVVCPARGCGSRIDIEFSIGDYLAHHTPRSPRGVARGAEAGWFTIADTDVSFRLPSGADQAALSREPDAVGELVQRCIRPSTVVAKTLRRVESAMAALAPNLFGELDGVCPECGATVGIPFDPQRWVLHELRGEATFVYEEVHLLAARYHWSEQEILALPRIRRARYAELVHAERHGG